MENNIVSNIFDNKDEFSEENLMMKFLKRGFQRNYLDDDKENETMGHRTRDTWTGKLDFILSCVGYAVGLGNMWRFPYMCYKNGGGAFLIPYIISVIFMGVPLFVLEVTLGQFMSIGGLGVWKLCPIFKGIGWATNVVAFWLNTYYIVVIAWTIFYLISSFQSNVPWATCDNKWNTVHCITNAEKTEMLKAIEFTNSSNNTVLETQRMEILETHTATEEFWYRRVLDQSSGIDEPGVIKLELALTLLLSWVLCYFCIWKGIKQTGKVVYVTALFPYVVLAALLIRGLTLEGSKDGLIFFLKPNFTKLQEPQVWLDAGSQVFFSYGVAVGSLIALGSYNTYNNNCFRDSVIVSIVNSSTSIFAGCAIFANLGYMASQQHKSVKDVAEQGPGLLFIVYPEVVTLMPLGHVWSVLFFIMVLLLGLDSQFCTVEGFITAIVDEYPRLLRPHRSVFIGIIVFISYLLGLTCVNQGGIFMFTLLDNYAATGYSLLWVAFFENISIAWFFGTRKFASCIKDMVGFRPNIWYQICWTFLTPLMIVTIFGLTLWKYKPLTYDSYKYPEWAQATGWITAFSSMSIIPLYMIYKLLSGNLSLKQRFQVLFNPTPDVQAKINKILQEKHFNDLQKVVFHHVNSNNNTAA